MGEHDDDDIDDNADESNLVRDLRKQLKAAKKANDDVAAEISQYRAQQRKASVADVLTERGAKPELAKFYTGEDTSKEAVAAWIDENKDLFGITTPDEEPDDADEVRAISQAASNAPQKKIGSLQNGFDLIAKAKTPAELTAAYKAAGLQFEQ